jgi:hypothetical protein
MKPILIMLAVAVAPVAIPVFAEVPQTSPVPSSAPSTSAVPHAAELYRQAFALLDGLDDADRQRLGMCGAEGCWVVTTPLDQATADLIARQKLAINLARTAAAMPEARWDLGGDASKMVELGNRAPRLSALLVLQARHELQAGEVKQALNDLMAALALSRHTAAGRTLLAKVVEGSAQRPAVEVLAQQLPSLPKELIATLPARFDQLPASHHEAGDLWRIRVCEERGGAAGSRRRCAGGGAEELLCHTGRRWFALAWPIRGIGR